MSARQVLHLSVEFLLSDLTALCAWQLGQDLDVNRALTVFTSIRPFREKARRHLELQPVRV